VCCCSYSVLSVTGIKSRTHTLLLSRSWENLAMSRVLRSCLQADHADVMVDAECLLVTKLQLVASHRLISLFSSLLCFHCLILQAKPGLHYETN